MERSLTAAAIVIRLLEARDSDTVVEIQAHSREAAQWSRLDYENAARDGLPCWVASDDARVIGFLVARKLVDEMEILNLAVAPASRRRGVGKLLLREAMNWAAQNAICRVHLEVRASNNIARRFYEARGFHATGVRPKYYRDPVDDALLLTADVPPAASE